MMCDYAGCVRGGTSFAFARTMLCDTAAARRRQRQRRRRRSDETKFVYIRHRRSTGQSFVVQTSNCIDQRIKSPLWNCVNCQPLSKLQNKSEIFVVKQRENFKFVRISRNRAQNFKAKNRKLSVSKSTEAKVILSSLTKEKSKNKNINQNVRKNECKFYGCWCCFRHRLHQ